MQTPSPPPPLSISGFLGAAFSAPGLAAIVCMLGTIAAAVIAPGAWSGLGSALFGLIMLTVIATVWGALPSLLFGGLVLAVIQRIRWRARPTAVVFMSGGLVAAGLYVLAGLGIAELSQGAAMFFAPWATTAFMSAGSSWWVFASLLMAGAGAGLIYAVCVKRG